MERVKDGGDMAAAVVGRGAGAAGAGKFEPSDIILDTLSNIPLTVPQSLPPLMRPSSTRASPTSNRGTSWTGTAPRGKVSDSRSSFSSNNELLPLYFAGISTRTSRQS